MAGNNKRRGPPPDQIDPHQIAMRLSLSAGKAAELCGISRRQLCYWTDKGIIEAFDDEDAETQPSRRMYSFAALRRAILIKSEIDRGSSLHRAAQDVETRLRAQGDRAHEIAEAPPEKREQFLADQADRMIAIAGRLREMVPGGVGRQPLRTLASALAEFRQAAPVSDGAALVEDPEACSRLASALDKIEELLDHMERAASE